MPSPLSRVPHPRKGKVSFMHRGYLILPFIPSSLLLARQTHRWTKNIWSSYKTPSARIPLQTSLSQLTFSQVASAFQVHSRLS